MSTTTVTSLDGFHATATAQRADELVRAFFDAVNADEQPRIDELVERGFLSYDLHGTRSRTGLKRYHADLRRSFSELRFDVDENVGVLAEGDLVALRTVRHRPGAQSRTWSEAHRTAGPGADQADRAAAHTTDATQQTPAPSPTPPPPRAAPSDPTQTRLHTQAAPSSQRLPQTRTTSTALRPARTPSRSRSRTAHSSRRPRSVRPPEPD